MSGRGGLLRLIAPSDPVGEFDCGVHPLNDFLRRHALANSEGPESLGKTWLLHRAADDPPGFPAILGFVTLAMGSVRSAQLSEALSRKLPAYPAPVALIGRLAVDQRVQGRKLGRVLLLEALHRVEEAAGAVGCLGVLVHAKEARALAFYERVGFVALEGAGWPRPLFLPMKTVAALLV